MKTENTDLDYFLELENNRRNMRGCHTGLLIILITTIIFWIVFFKVLNWIF